jgi:hypothetical protein
MSVISDFPPRRADLAGISPVVVIVIPCCSNWSR